MILEGLITVCVLLLLLIAVGYYYNNKNYYSNYNTKDTVPFLLEITLMEHHGYFLIDTGSNVNVLKEGIVEIENNKEDTECSNIMGGGGSFQGALVEIPFTYNNKKTKEIFYISDISEALSAMTKSLNLKHPILGVIGIEFLKKNKAVLKFTNNTYKL